MSGSIPHTRSWWQNCRGIARRIHSTRPARYTRVAVGRFLRDDATTLAGHVAFTALFSLFPFLIVLIALAGLLGQNESAHALIYTMLDYLPVDIVNVLQPPIDKIIKGAGGGVITIGLVTALWTAASVVESLRLAVNRAFGVRQQRAMWLRRMESIALVALLALALVMAVAILFVLPAIIAPAADFLGISQVWVRLVKVARPPLVLLAMFSVVWILFRVLPNARLKARPLLPAAILVVVLWALAGAGFSVYLRTVATYNIVYGGLGGVVVALMFFYLLAAVFILGAYFAAVHARVHGGLHRKIPRARADARRV